jgi:hypothetical protein
MARANATARKERMIRFVFVSFFMFFFLFVFFRNNFHDIFKETTLSDAPVLWGQTRP